jgi:alkylation response protein AidB-like acyl-CoA dehydrogenase
VEFTWSDEEEALRTNLRAFVHKNKNPSWDQMDRDLGEDGLRSTSIAFCESLGERGWLTPHWPKQYGGLDASAWERIIVGEELWGAGEPRGPQYMNVNWIGPALMFAGTPAQKMRHLPRISKGNVIWCQGFSEPDAGSDLASLTTRAVRDGDEYIVNGAKVWTSYAHEAEWCFLLVRTGQDEDRHQGITILLVPMDTPGIEVREINTPFGPHVIHEVAFRDARVSVEHRLGAENEGWPIVRRILAEERIGIARYAYHARIIEDAMSEAADDGRDLTDSGLQEEIGISFALCEAARILNYVAVQEWLDEPDGRRPLASTWRAMGAGFVEVRTRETLLSILGPSGLENRSAGEFQQFWGVISPIAAGNLEVQLDMIARAQLGLPKG